MKLVKWSNSSPLAQLHDEFDRMVERVFGEPSFALRGSPAFAPPVDVVDRGDHLRVRAEIAGIEPADVKVTFEHGLLVIAGEKRHEARTEKDAVCRYECSYGAFRRVVELPAEVDVDKADANFKNGILTIHLPKPEKAKARELKIKAE
jgi:HSP20 family protein